jgi:hypothetical protein
MADQYGGSVNLAEMQGRAPNDPEYLRILEKESTRFAKMTHVLVKPKTWRDTDARTRPVKDFLVEMTSYFADYELLMGHPPLENWKLTAISGCLKGSSREYW